MIKRLALFALLGLAAALTSCSTCGLCGDDQSASTSDNIPYRGHWAAEHNGLPQFDHKTGPGPDFRR